MQALVFDLDDTLYSLDRHRGYHLRRAWAQWLSSLAVDHADEIIADAVRERIFFRDMPDFLDARGVSLAINEQLCQRSRSTWFTDLMFDDGVEALLHRLNTRYRLALITNGPSWTQRAKIEQLQLHRWFEYMVVSGEFGVDKPDPQIFAHVLDTLQIPASQAVMIGDNPDADMRGAHAVGMSTIWIAHQHHVYPADIAPAWQRVTHVTEIAQFVEV